MKGATTAMTKKRNPHRPRLPTTLRFSPPAWAKLLYLRDAGKTEVCGFGIADAGDLLHVEDVVLVHQLCTWVSAELEDAAVADFFDAQVDQGRQPEQFGRVFLHTHPGDSPKPSNTDEATFGRVFGSVEWAVMFILARGGACYARLRYNVGPGLDVELPVEVDYGQPFAATDWDAWQEEYEAHVHQQPEPEPPSKRQSARNLLQDDFDDPGWQDVWDESADFDLSGGRLEYERF
jgi:proteasome lid subunit RPN8/RPN11